MAISIYLQKITFNVNGLNAPVKRHREADWIQKTRPCNMPSTRDSIQAEDTQSLKVSGQKKIFHANGNDKKARLAILISDKTDFKTKTIMKDKEGHYIMIKRSI